MSAKLNTSKKTRTPRFTADGANPIGIGQQQSLATAEPTSHSGTSATRPPLTPAEKAEKEARKAARAANRATEAAKEAIEAAAREAAAREAAAREAAAREAAAREAAAREAAAREAAAREAAAREAAAREAAAREAAVREAAAREAAAREAAAKEAADRKKTEIKISQKDAYLGEKPIWQLSNYDIYVLKGIKLKEFVRDITEFSINNSCDQHHTKQIEEGIRQIITLDNCFNVVIYADGTIQILDGQHRRNALRSLPDRELLRKEIVIHLYKSDRPDSAQTTQLFNRFNLVKPFKVIIETTNAIQQIITGLRCCVGFSDKAIRPTDRETAHAPAMSIKQFSNYLEPLLTMLGPGNYIVSDIVKYINQINQEFGVDFDRESADRLFKGEPIKNITRKQSMRQIQFYLNTELSKSEWPKRLLEKLRATNS